MFDPAWRRFSSLLGSGSVRVKLLPGNTFDLRTTNPRDCVVWFSRYLRRSSTLEVIVHGFPTSKTMVDSAQQSGVRLV